VEKEIIIYQEWGGLGDNLAHTTIPLLCKKYGYDCYLSKHNKFNNQETYDLLYKDLNLPLTDKIYPDWLHNYPKPTSSDWNHIRSIQLGYGFPEAPYSYPVIQYTPKYIEELKDITLVDLSGVHYFKYFKHIFTSDKVKHLYNKILSLDTFDNILQIEKTHQSAEEIIVTKQKYLIDSLYHYCDALFSCKDFITIDSGQSNLASTIKNQHLNNKRLNIYTIGLQKNLPPNSYDSYFYNNTNHIALDTGWMHKAIDY
tara:strand:+ start:195 stop:962 length:768 start_codon:yes stop_codon:yes gene_type:complete